MKIDGFYILNSKGVILEWVEDSYTATHHANAKADIFRKVYYVYNCNTKVMKPCYGYRKNTNSRYTIYR